MKGIRVSLATLALALGLGGSALAQAGASELEEAVQSRPAAELAGGNVTYEEIVGCGLFPQETRLECIIEIKQTNGYGGGIGAIGTFEHVLFCVDWNQNGTFAANEVVGHVTLQMHDESAGASPPWFYAVYRDVVPPGGARTDGGGIGGAGTTTTSTNGPTYAARAILSWPTAPTGCGFNPTWGNVFNFDIRLDPIR